MHAWYPAALRGISRFGTALVCAALALVATTTRAATLDAALLPKIEAATFEVVQAKPTNDPLSYEKPLPLDLLPYQQRTDKYHSIGTAFAIGNGRYVTAGHVLLAGLDSLWGPPALRDGAGHVYPIAKVEKFALRRDFVVFTLATPPASGATLALDPRPQPNTTVYAVGNALGTGIVIRDGLYTSDTPEPQDGAWKWLRFSAAASPGNSGGPLLDQQGKVVGVVLMKSANENLNYALPIGELLNAPADTARMSARGSYQLDLFTAVSNGNLDAHFALPLDLAAFYREFGARFSAYSEKQFQSLLAHESANLFPNGAGSRRLLYQQTILNSFPSLIVRGSDGEWGLSNTGSQYFALDHNGYVRIGEAGRNGLVHLRRPDDIPAAKFYADAQTRMDLLARTGLFQRMVAGQKIKITSLGKPIRSATHRDRWQRPWQIDAWALPYANRMVLAYTLPVPDGSVMLMRFLPPTEWHDSRLDLDEMSSFVYATYAGTLAQWREFLADPALLPAVMHDIHLDYTYGQRFGYRSPRLTFSYPSSLQTVAPDNLLWLGFRFFLDGGKPTWDAGIVNVWKNTANDDQYEVNVQRHMAPPAGLDTNFDSLWRKIAAREYPYNAVANPQNGQMGIDGVAGAPGVATPTVLYTAFYGATGAPPQAEMKTKLDVLTKDLQVREH